MKSALIAAVSVAILPATVSAQDSASSSGQPEFAEEQPFVSGTSSTNPRKIAKARKKAARIKAARIKQARLKHKRIKMHRIKMARRKAAAR